MQLFTQKYAIIQLFEEAPIGTEFFWKNWPLHCTIADVFAITWDVSTMQKELARLLSNCAQAESTVENDLLFGNGQVRVAGIKKTNSLVKLHEDVIKLLERGGWNPNNPEFAKQGFLPHSTVQEHARLNKGDKVIFNALSIVDFFPGEDPYKRKILATIHISSNHPIS